MRIVDGVAQRPWSGELVKQKPADLRVGNQFHAGVNPIADPSERFVVEYVF